MQKTRGLIARAVLRDSHTFVGEPINDQQKYELTRPKCRAMTEQIKRQPIPLLINHGRDSMSGKSVPLGEVYNAEFDEATGDWVVDYRISTEGNNELNWRMIKANDTPWGLSLAHQNTPNGPVAVEVSLCAQGGMRDGSWVIGSTDSGMKTMPYNIDTIGNSYSLV
jgi:hypothetical protein